MLIYSLIAEANIIIGRILELVFNVNNRILLRNQQLYAFPPQKFLTNKQLNGFN